MSLFHVKHNPEKNVHKEGWHHFIAFFGLFITELCTKTECLQSRTVTTFDGRGRLRQKISCRADSAGTIVVPTATVFYQGLLIQSIC